MTKKTNYLLIGGGALLVLVLGYIFFQGATNFGPGLADYEVQITDSCKLERSSAHTVIVRCEGISDVDPEVTQLGWNEDYLIATTHPVTKKAYPDNPNNSYMLPDESITYWWIRDLKNKKAYGPMSQTDFTQKKGELKISDIQLMSVDAAKAKGTAE